MTASRDSALIISNGRGEDAVGAAIARALMPHIQPVAYPLAGLGEGYENVPLLNPRLALPSGGFALRSGARALLADIRHGGLGLWREQRRALAAQRDRHDIVVAVGDAYCLWMAALAAAPVVFVATAKSQYNEPHRWPELRLMRRRAGVTFARDRLTADALAARGITAQYAGNPLMDIIPPPEGPLPLPPGLPVVLLLPGSRADAIRNVLVLIKLGARLDASVAAAFTCAIPSTVAVAQLVRAAAGAGWEVDGEFLRSGQTSILLTRDFGATLKRAAVAVGLAGTANEQAAGLGIPVVAFPPPGAVQFTPHFLALQQRLLGDALISSVDWETAAEGVRHLLADPAERERRGAIGRARMGAPGAVRVISEKVREMVQDAGGVANLAGELPTSPT